MDPHLTRVCSAGLSASADVGHEGPASSSGVKTAAASCCSEGNVHPNVGAQFHSQLGKDRDASLAHDIRGGGGQERSQASLFGCAEPGVVGATAEI